MSDVDRDTWPVGGTAQVRRALLGSAKERLPIALDPLAFPRLAERSVIRTRELARLNRLAPLTIVEALPGFGKTTLVAAWARARQADGDRVVWVNATPGADDPRVFLDLVQRGLVRAGAARLVTAPRTASAGPPMSLELVGPAHRPVLMVVDDAHHLREPLIAHVLLKLVREARWLHLAVVTEIDHQFAEAAARFAVETNVLRGGDLTVSADEVSTFAEAWGHPLQPEDGRRLHRLLGGWLLPLRLTLDATPAWSAGFVTKAAEEFLTSHALPSSSDPASLAMSMRLAVPDGVDEKLASALLEDHLPADVAAHHELAKRERRGLLWRSSRRNGQAEWHYPKLVRRTLLEAFERSDRDSALRSHRRVARALRSEPGQHRSSQLLRHARAAGDWALLEELWVEQGWSLAGADAEAFELAYAGLEPSIVEKRPSLRVAAVVADALTGTRGFGWVARTEALVQCYTQLGKDLTSRTDRQLAGPTLLVETLTAAMVAERSKGRLPEAGRLASEAARALDRARLLEPTQLGTSRVAWFHLQDAITQAQSGKYSRALEAAATAHQLGPSNLVGAGAAALLAALHATGGHATDAQEWLLRHESSDMEGHWAAGLAQLPARLARAMLAMDRLDGEAAEEELAGVPLGPEASGLWPLVLITHTRHELLFGDPAAMLVRVERLRRVLARHVASPGAMASQVFDRCSADLLLALGEVNRLERRLAVGTTSPPWLSVPAARFHLMTGDATKAAQLADLGTWRDGVHVRDHLELLVISAAAWHALGSIDLAQRSFVRAHALGAEIGNHQLWLWLPADAREDLLGVSGLELDSEVRTRLDGMRRPFPERVELVRLSQRELEVLRQVRHHDTVAAIAGTLSVSVNTVKKQLISLYGKLGVHDRSSAVLRAQRLGLLDDA